jgi:cell division protein FtsA
VLIGGGSRLSGIVEAAKDMLQLPAQMGTPPSTLTGMIDSLDDPLYTTAVGLMLMGLHQANQPARPMQLGQLDNHLSGVMDKAKGLFKNLLP